MPDNSKRRKRIDAALEQANTGRVEKEAAPQKEESAEERTKRESQERVAKRLADAMARMKSAQSTDSNQ